VSSAQCWLFKPLLTGRLTVWIGWAIRCRQSQGLSLLFQKQPQRQRGLLALAVSHADSSLMTLLCLSHLDVRTSPSGGHPRAPELTPIIRNEQQRLTLLNA
jgi:hypothetical protein